MHPRRDRRAFTLIELLVVIAIIAILAVVVVLTLNPAQLLAQSRDANRVSDMATLQSALNIYTTDQSGNLQLGVVSSTYISVYDPQASSTCGFLGLPALSTSTGQTWTCSSSSNYRLATSTGWIGVNFNLISSGSPFGSLPVDPVNQTSSGLFYAYNTNGSQFEVTADFESSKYKSNYGNNIQTTYFPDVISGGTPGISALYNPTGLVGYWPLNEGVGSTTVDASGNNNGGTWTGTPIGSNNTYYTAGKVGSYAGDFNGSNDYVNVGVINNFSNTITLSAWAKTTNASAGWIFIIGQAPSTSCTSPYSTYGIAFDPSQSYFDFELSNSSAVRVQTLKSATVAANTWYYLTGVYNGSLMTLYINGVVVATSVQSGNILNSSYAAVIGNQGVGACASFFPGSINDARIYNRALSPAEIMALYNAEH